MPDAPDPVRTSVAGRCDNCGASATGAFCAGCGQRAEVLRQPVHHFLRDAFAEFFGLDGRVWRTLGTLLFRPGALTSAYHTGRRQLYLRPLRVYLSSTLLFFFLLSVIDPISSARDGLYRSSDMAEDSLRVSLLIAQTDSALVETADSIAAASVAEARADRRRRSVERAILATMPPDSVVYADDIRGAAHMVYPDTASIFSTDGDWRAFKGSALRGIVGARTEAERADNTVAFLRAAVGYVPTVLFLILPVFAFLLKLLYARRDWFYSEHVVFGLHTHAFAFVVFAAVTVLVWTTDGSAPGWITGALLGSIPVYFFVAQKRVYGQSWRKTLFKAVVLGTVYNLVLGAGIVGAILLAAMVG